MNTFLLIGVIVLVAIAFVKFGPRLFKNDNANNNTSRPSADSKPVHQVPNDKLVIVGSISYDDVKKAIISYCNMYNNNDWAALPRLTKMANGKFAITFPYDIEFELFCYFVNYMAYPEEVKIGPEVIAWTTTSPKDNWIKPQAANKKAMFFLPQVDTEYDFVLMTTEDNIGYKLGFAIGEQKQLLETPEKSFVTPPINLVTLSSMEWEDIC